MKNILYFSYIITQKTFNGGVFGPLTICWCFNAQCLVWRRTLSRGLVLGFWQAVNTLGRLDYHLGGPVVQRTSYTVAIGPGGYLVSKKKKKKKTFQWKYYGTRQK